MVRGLNDAGDDDESHDSSPIPTAKIGRSLLNGKTSDIGADRPWVAYESEEATGRTFRYIEKACMLANYSQVAAGIRAGEEARRFITTHVEDLIIGLGKIL